MKRRQWIAVLAFALATVALSNQTGIVVEDAERIRNVLTNENTPVLTINPRIVIESANSNEEASLQPLPVTLGAGARHFIIGANANETRLLTFPQGLPGDLPSYVYFSASYLPFVKH